MRDRPSGLPGSGIETGEGVVWVPRRRFPASRIPASVRPSLLDPGSLTARVRALCGDGFDVQLLRHEPAQPHPEERRVLRLRQRSLAVIREVNLRCAGEPLVFAHSVIPWRSIRGRWRRLWRFGRRPLGEALFSDPSVRRGRMELARVEPGSAMYNRIAALAGKADEPVWGRRSEFILPGGSILVCEFFLPAFLRRRERTGSGS